MQTHMSRHRGGTRRHEGSTSSSTRRRAERCCPRTSRARSRSSSTEREGRRKEESTRRRSDFRRTRHRRSDSEMSTSSTSSRERSRSPPWWLPRRRDIIPARVVAAVLNDNNITPISTSSSSSLTFAGRSYSAHDTARELPARALNQAATPPFGPSFSFSSERFNGPSTLLEASLRTARATDETVAMPNSRFFPLPPSHAWVSTTTPNQPTSTSIHNQAAELSISLQSSGTPVDSEDNAVEPFDWPAAISGRSSRPPYPSVDRNNRPPWVSMMTQNQTAPAQNQVTGAFINSLSPSESDPNEAVEPLDWPPFSDNTNGPTAKDTLDKLPQLEATTRFLAMSVKLFNVDCSVCTCDFTKGELLTQLPCKHLYHFSCLQPWLGKANTCPTCRFELPRENPPRATIPTPPPIRFELPRHLTTPTTSLPTASEQAAPLPQEDASDFNRRFSDFLNSYHQGERSWYR
eukprot:gb/GEZN01007719.1/.p1 GENE.gb/GEZN01007719.1/~~gb/GEZN01007719.1/.p1  ORF type:complete len:462 (+),score=4.20 gb/GEZN01007719.1/:75-1460(+)